MKIRSHHCPDQKRQCLHLIVTIQWNFLPISNALQHLTTPTSPSRHQCPDLTEGPALTQTCKGCSSCSRLCLHLYSLTGRPLLSPVSLCSNVTSTRAVFLVCVCVCVCMHMISPLLFFATLWTVACQASLSLGLSRQEYWSGLPFPPPGDLPGTTFYHTALLLFIDYHLRQWFISIPLFTFEFNVC